MDYNSSTGAAVSRATLLLPSAYLNGSNVIEVDAFIDGRAYAELNYNNNTLRLKSIVGSYVNQVVVYAR